MTVHDEHEARSFCAGYTDDEGLKRLDRLAVLMLAENRVQNLIAKSSEEFLWRRHFADSAQLLAYVSRKTSPWLDLGTGAGPPGLVIAAMRPDTVCVLVESRRKRAEWLSRAALELGLTNCRVEGRKLESVESFSAGIISARAFAPLPKLLDLSARFSTPDTMWLLPKGRSAGQEVQDLPTPSAALFHVEQSATDPQAGIIVGRGRPEPA
ncbi:16S rRNA (guanine(527)-N(7))-methyltransferase RsmG [Croceibacterium aestuarii]|uniref:16S rRNA (guanine(527)-N(7))-methyltransferase RsmG n=1 Tax=Croceibacterium aestuarii TaxID=3064139 RepID=UPI00272EBBB9|nr:16S rRNA (guanine(527)-N(7))-methyltransferase RsmG [Croceibacterium sp. D39]